MYVCVYIVHNALSMTMIHDGTRRYRLVRNTVLQLTIQNALNCGCKTTNYEFHSNLQPAWLIASCIREHSVLLSELMLCVQVLTFRVRYIIDLSYFKMEICVCERSSFRPKYFYLRVHPHI